jgi:hypothetical protein
MNRLRTSLKKQILERFAFTPLNHIASELNVFCTDTTGKPAAYHIVLSSLGLKATFFKD